MESIKEKSHEIAWQYSKHYDPIACRQEWCEMAARDGANYVLEQIEKLVKFNRWSAQDLYELIEQLKK